MPTRVSAALTRRLEDLIVAETCRRYPALQLVPARWMRLAVAPATARLRRILWRAVLAAATPIGIIIVLLFIKL